MNNAAMANYSVTDVEFDGVVNFMFDGEPVSLGPINCNDCEWIDEYGNHGCESPSHEGDDGHVAVAAFTEGKVAVTMLCLGCVIALLGGSDPTALPGPELPLESDIWPHGVGRVCEDPDCMCGIR
jgi:hypothetical protein